jgi:predicted enzyme related to lactoylglutathione lyase
MDSTHRIVAVMIHVADVSAALAWYQLAFPTALRSRIDGFEFEVLTLGNIRIEIVPADDKVGSGPSGSVVYWQVDNFSFALERLSGIGAKLYRGPMEIEGGWRMCQVQDPWGNCIGLRGPF